MLPGAWGALAFAYSSGTSQTVHKHNDRVPRRRMKSASGGPASVRSTRTSRIQQERKAATALPDLVFVLGENSCFFFVGWEKTKLPEITYKQLVVFCWVEKNVTRDHM